MKKTVLILIFLLPVFSPVLFCQYLSFTDGPQITAAPTTLPERTFINDGPTGCSVGYNFTGALVAGKEVEGVDYQFLQIEGFAPMGQVGAPALPSHNEIIAMPRNSNGRIEILHTEYYEYEGYLIHPVLEPAADTEGADEPEFERNEQIYSTNKFFPENIVKIVNVGLSRGTPLANTQVRPVQFNPVTGIIRVYTKISYRIDFVGGFGSFDYIAAENSLHYTNLLKLNVLNSESIPNGIDTGSGYSGSGSRTGEKNYIIITHSAYLSQANQLANWKRQLGYTVEVVSQSGWNATQVKSAISTRYNSWTPHPDYFVIIGDHTGSYAVPGEIHQSVYNGADFATDLYYACMDGLTDWHPEMAHGRISCSSPTEAGVIVNKIIDYEKTPPTTASYYTNMLSCAQYQVYSPETGYAERRFCHTSEEIRDYLQNSHSYTSTRVYWTDSGWPLATRRYNNTYYSTGQLLPADLRDVGFNWNGGASDITTAINNGKFMVFHRDHGYTGGSGWAHPYYTTTSMESLTNGSLLPVVFSMNCSTGDFLAYNCFAEKFLRMENRGAVGVIAASYTSYSGYNDAMSVGLIDAIWATPGLYPVMGTGGTGANYTIGTGNEIYTMGDVLNQGLYAMEQNWWGSTTYEQYAYELFHYFGDPAMRIWTSNPNSNIITAIHPTTVDCSGTDFLVSGSTPGATATLVVNNKLIYKTTLDGSGNGTFAYSITEPDTAMLFTISKQNHKPYVSSIPMNGTCAYPPAITTNATACVGSSTATANGVVGHDFGSAVLESGVVYAPTPNPRCDSSGCTTLPTSPTITAGSFSSSLTGLGGGTNYYLCAYARNAHGTSYGIDDEFTTNANAGAVILPWTEDWENAGVMCYTADQICLAGLPEWDYDRSVIGGRLRLDVGTSFCHGGCRAATLDRELSGSTNINYLTATLDLSAYSGASDLELSFYYMHHGEESHWNDRVWVRGSNTDPWVQIYDLYANRGTAGNWNTVSSLDIDATLSGASQIVSSTFQLRFGQEDNWPANSTTASDGFTFDDISITKSTPLPNLNVQNVAVTDGQSNCYDATNTLTVAGSGSNVHVYSGGVANFIAGNKIVVNPGFYGHPGSEVSFSISTGSYCGSVVPMANVTAIEEEETNIEDVMALSTEIKIYPNPSTGQFNVEFENGQIDAEIFVFNMHGMMVYQSKCKDQNLHIIDLNHMPSGMYLIIIKTEDTVLKEKLILN